MLQIISIIAVIAVMMSVVAWGQRKLTKSLFSKVLVAIFALYVVGNLYCTLFSRVPDSGVIVELVPFMSIVRLFTKPIEAAGEVKGFFAWFMQGSHPIAGIVLNILLYFPLGYLLSVLIPKYGIRHILLIGCICSVATELIQYLLKMGYCETDDVLYNTIGTAIGVWVWNLQFKRLNKHKSNELPKD